MYISKFLVNTAWALAHLMAVLCGTFAMTAWGIPPAQAQTWQVFEQAGGYKIARGGTSGGSGLVQGIALTCERNVPIVALSLARAPARNPALLSLSDGKATGQLGLVRNGASNVWAGPVRDTRVLNMLARAANIVVGIDSVRYGSVSLAGAADAMRAALGECWREPSLASANETTPVKGDSVPSLARPDTGLPPQLANDISDYDASCRKGNVEEGSWGSAVLEQDAVRRADFNGDGTDDYLLDGTKMHCSRLEKDNHTSTLAVYTSESDGAFKRTLHSYLGGNVTVVKGAKASLRLYQPAMEEGDEDVTETLFMRSATSWSPSELANKGWVDLIPVSAPVELRQFFEGWEKRCEDAGRPMAHFQWLSDLHTKDQRGGLLDFNGDGKQDYILNTSQIQCGLFSTNPIHFISESCPEKCGVFAVVSAPDGSYSVQPIERSEHTVGAWEYVRSGNKVSICAVELVPDETGAYGWQGDTVMYSWAGTTKNRRVLALAGSGDFRCPAS